MEPAGPNPLADLEVLVRARHPVLAIESREEERVEETLREVARRLQVPLFRWSLTRGLARDGPGVPLHDSADPLKALEQIATRDGEGIYLLSDLHRLLEDPKVLRKVLDVARSLAGGRSALVLTGEALALPPALAPLAARMRLALPGRRDLDRAVSQALSDLLRAGPVRVEISKEDYERLLHALAGLTRFEAERAVTRAILEDGALTGEDVARVVELKREALARDGVLEYVPPEAGAVEVGGLARLREWLGKRRAAFTEDARRFGLPPPRGVVLLGVQGCGKSMAAKAVARLWGLPLLRLEAGRLYDKWLGESEKNLERALDAAERMAPCVLWIDEIEKGFAGLGASEADAGLSRRLLGRMLSWLQERRAAVFVAATCNRVADLPPEMMRKGRFDEVFFVDLPREEERREIFAHHLAARRRAPEAFDVPALAAATEGFSGAEIEQVVVAGLYTAFGRGEDLSTRTLRDEIAATTPLSATRREEVEALRAWARGRAVPAG